MTTRSDDDATGLHALGRAGVQPALNGPDVRILECFPNRYPDRNYIVSFNFPEFTSLCPVTGQPDFGCIRLTYIPDLSCVESKSFKLYMFAFRNHQSFMETLTNRILDDLESILKPRWIRVSGLFAPRGATRIDVHAEKYKLMSAEAASEVRKAVADNQLVFMGS